MNRTCTSDVFFVIVHMALPYQPVITQRDISSNESPIYQAKSKRAWKWPIATIHSGECIGKTADKTEGKAINWLVLCQANEKELPVFDTMIPVKSKDKLPLRSIVPGYPLTQTNPGTCLMIHNGFTEHLQATEIGFKILCSDQLIKSQRLGESRHGGMMQADTPMKHSPVLTNTNRLQERAADPGKCEKKGKCIVQGAKNRCSEAFVTSISRCTTEEDRSRANGTSMWRRCITDAGLTHYRRAEKEKGVIDRIADHHEEVE